MSDNLPSGYVPNYTTLQLEACRYATTSNMDVTLIPDSGETTGLGTILENNGTLDTLVIDGKNPNVCDRVVVSYQTAAEQNGIYIVRDVGSLTTPWQLVRDPAFSDPIYLVPGYFVIVTDGSTKAGKQYVFTYPLPTTFNTDPVYFIES